MAAALLLGLEEYIIRDFFQDRRDGIFVDVGAFHAREQDNTYRLERDLGWRGLALDANGRPSRPSPSSIGRAPVSSRRSSATPTSALAHLHLYEREPIVASGDPSFTANSGKPTQTMTAPNRTLNSLLSEHGIARVDFMSMDIETGEPAALTGFAIDTFKPSWSASKRTTLCDRNPRLLRSRRLRDGRQIRTSRPAQLLLRTARHGSRSVRMGHKSRMAVAA